MNKFRYIEKKTLCEFDLREEFFDSIGLNINDIIPLRKILVLFTQYGKKVLKITDYSEERVKFIDKSLSYITNSYKNVLRYWKINDDIIFNWNGKKFIILDMIDGREATFTNPIEVKLCAEALASVHKASSGLMNELSIDEINNNKAENLEEKLIYELETLNTIECIVNKFKYKNEFDDLYINNVDAAKKDLIKTIDKLKKSNYKKMYENNENLILCHNDLAHHNFIIDNDEVSLIDFDYCNLNIKIMDLYNYIIKVSKNFAYDKDVINVILEDYSKVNNITDDEKEILNILINYPRDFINISLDYYLKQKSWDEEVFISRFKNKLELDEFRRELLVK